MNDSQEAVEDGRRRNQAFALRTQIVSDMVMLRQLSTSDLFTIKYDPLSLIGRRKHSRN
jgi:hypothetical protein